MEVLQPLTRGISTKDIKSSCVHGTYLGTDCGPEGTGMWHSLSGTMEDKENTLDLARCFPLVRAERQASCVGATVRARGAGSLRLELKSADDRVVWWGIEELPLGDEWRDLHFFWDPKSLRKVKSLHWAAEPGSLVHLDSLALRVRMPDTSLEEELFLVSYAKLGRLYSCGLGTVRERGPEMAGGWDSVSAGGLFCLATSVASGAGLVKRAQAEQILRKVYATVAEVPTAAGLLPAAIKIDGAERVMCEGSFYSVLDTSLYYHSMLLAAQMLWDGKTLAGLVASVRQISFDPLHDPDGFVVHGLGPDGETPVEGSWRHWGSEAALVLLLEYMATGAMGFPGLEDVGEIKGGVGLSAELASLFYPDFSIPGRDAVAGADWLGARRALLEEQMAYLPRKRGKSAAARLGLYGLSTGEDPDGEGYRVGGTRIRDRHEVIRPHYALMSASIHPDPEALTGVLRTLKEEGLVQPWGMVGGFDRELGYTPVMGSFSAALECLAAYHLWTRSRGERDLIYDATEDCGLLREAICAFYAPNNNW